MGRGGKEGKVGERMGGRKGEGKGEGRLGEEGRGGDEGETSRDGECVPHFLKRGYASGAS
jgi:hypothetical protein